MSDLQAHPLAELFPMLPEKEIGELADDIVTYGQREPIVLATFVLTSDDGTVFDSSETHGGAQPFTMDQVFPGFAEAMTKMQEGGQYRFTMPQKLAFGNSPPPPSFPKNSALTFEVRVEKVVRGGAALLQQQMLQQQMQQEQQQAPQQ